jgi:Phage integrase, N-terminal SAM-like domain
MTSGLAPPKLLDRVREAIRARHYSRRTEDVYVHWIRRYIVFHNKTHQSNMNMGARDPPPRASAEIRGTGRQADITCTRQWCSERSQRLRERRDSSSG